MNKDYQDEYDDLAHKALRGQVAATILDGKYAGNTTNLDKFQDYLNDNVHNKTDKSDHWKSMIITPVFNRDGKPIFRATDSKGNSTTFDISGTDIGDKLNFIPIKSIKRQFQRDGSDLTSTQAKTLSTIAFSQMGTFINGNEVIKDNDNKELKVTTPINIMQLESKVNHALKGQVIKFTADNGSHIQFKKIDGTGQYGGNVLISMEDENGKLIPLYSKGYESFHDGLSDLMQSYNHANSKVDTKANSIFNYFISK